MRRVLPRLAQFLVVCPLIAAPTAVAEIVISEIMYNPAGTDVDTAATPPYNREWVEIYNNGAAAVNLSGWQLGDSQDNDWAQPLPAGLLLAPLQALVVTGDSSTFDSQWGAGLNPIQVGNFPSLANTPSPTNETVANRDAAGSIRDQVNYDDAGGWTVIDGSVGASIFATPGGLSTAANDVGTNWKPSMWGVYGGQYRNVGGGNHASPGFVDTVTQATFAPSPDASWSMIVVPDTQNYVKASQHHAKLDKMMEWIRDHSDEFKIQLVLQEGDIVNQNSAVTPTSGDQSATEQWQNARDSFGILNGHVPYIMATGNHDQVVDAADYEIWRQRFGQAAGAGSARWSAASNVPEPAALALLLLGFALLPVPPIVRRCHARGQIRRPRIDRAPSPRLCRGSNQHQDHN